MAIALAVTARLAGQDSSTGISNPGFQNDGSSFSIPPQRPVAICFPPSPPPLDQPISHRAQAVEGAVRLKPPAELAAYLNEPFYAPLSTWLLEHRLSDKMRERIAALHTAKENLLTELRATLEQTRDTAPAERHATLEALAKRQTPPLAALEREAEQIRSDLAISDYDWRNLREWSIGGKFRRGDSPIEIAATMRAYAYYQSGVGLVQRGLLREIALEVAAAGEDTATAAKNQPYVFFSPEPARVLLPDDVPAALSAKIAEYQTKKSALKTELYDAVYKEDDASFSFLRNSALKSLTVKQADRVAALDRLAEEIRRGLAELPSATRREATAGGSLPPVLTARLAASMHTRNALQKDTMQQIDALRAKIADEPFQVSYEMDQNGMKFDVAFLPRSFHRASAQAPEKFASRRQAIAAAMGEIAAEFNQRYAAYINEIESIRLDTLAALGDAPPAAIQAAVADARRSIELSETADAYREYRQAVFEPGLSPEQRRLLFGGALVNLDLPLLRGEYQPVHRAAVW